MVMFILYYLYSNINGQVFHNPPFCERHQCVRKHFGELSLIYGYPYFKPVLVQVANTLIKLNLFSNAKNPGKGPGEEPLQ